MFQDRWPLSFFQTTVLAACFYGAYYVYWQLTVGVSRRRLSTLHTCKPTRKWRAHPLLFGLDFFYSTYKALKAHRALENIATHFWLHGANTVQINVLGKTFVSTIEPENLKSVLAKDFKNWRVGNERKKVLGPLLGEGIFTSDGAA